MRSAPAVASIGAASRSTPPDTSTSVSTPSARRRETHPATRSRDMLSSMITVAPAATASSTWDRWSHSTSTMPSRPQRLGPGHGVPDGQPGQVVVLDQHGVGQAPPVVVPTAGPDRGLLEGPESRGGLAGVEHPGGRVGGLHRVDVPPGQGGHPGQVPEEVEDGPLGGEDGAQGADDLGHVVPGGHGAAVADPPGHLQGRVDLSEGLEGAGPAGDHADGPAHDGHPGRGGHRDQGRGQVAQGQQVLGQGPGHRVDHRTRGEGRGRRTRRWDPRVPVGGAQGRGRPARGGAAGPARTATPSASWTMRRRQRSEASG